MNITTDRLLLKEIKWDDIQRIHELHSIPEVEEFNTIGIPENLDATKKLMNPEIKNQKLKVRTRFCWCIFRKEDNEFIGVAGMSNSSDRFKIGEIYYKLHPNYWGNGYATEIANAQISFGFKVLKLHRIEAGVATENHASIRVLEKVGMKNEGVRRKILPIRGEWKDNYHFAIVEDEHRDCFDNINL